MAKDFKRENTELRDYYLTLMYLGTEDVQRKLIETRGLGLPDDAHLARKKIQVHERLAYVKVEIKGSEPSDIKGYAPPRAFVEKERVKEREEKPESYRDEFRGFFGRRRFRRAMQEWENNCEARRQGYLKAAKEETLQMSFGGGTQTYIWDGTVPVVDFLREGHRVTMGKEVRGWTAQERGMFPEIAPDREAHREHRVVKASTFIAVLPHADLTEGEVKALKEKMIFVHTLGDDYNEWMKEALKQYKGTSFL